MTENNQRADADHRQWHHRHWFVGTLIPHSALHVGSGAGDIRTDSLCLRDGNGQLLVPGTSLRGVMRSFLENTFPSQKGAITDLFGPELQKQDMRAGEGWASRVVFHDLYPEVTPPTRVRDGVGIRRDRLTHRHRLKYDFETLPPGTPFRFSLYFNASDATLARDKNLLLAALEELRHERLPLGGTTSRGTGWCRLNMTGVYCLNFSDPDCLIAFLKKDSPEELSDQYRLDYSSYLTSRDVTPPTPETNWLQIELDLHIAEPIVVNSRYRDEDYDVTFVRMERYHIAQWTPTVFLPGGSIKGALRNRAEMILRTLVPSPHRLVACDPTDPEESCTAYLKQVEKQKGQSLEPYEVYTNQCQICSLFGSAYYAGRVSLQDTFPVGDVVLKPFDWVAIDRFTGGAVEAKKFDGQLATAGTFRAVLFARNLLEEDADSIRGLERLALLAHLLKDLHCEDIPIGHGKFKGFGKLRARVVNVTVGCGEDRPLCRFLAGLGFPSQQQFGWHVFSLTPEHLYAGTALRLSAPAQRLVEQLDQAFTAWITRLTSQTQEAGQ